jgi:hypothetical protein
MYSVLCMRMHSTQAVGIMDSPTLLCIVSQQNSLWPRAAAWNGRHPINSGAV